MTLDEALGKIRQLLSERGSITNGELVTAVGDDLDLARQVREKLVDGELARDEQTRLVPAVGGADRANSPAAPEGAWIFVSHSHRDLEEVRRVRNALEAKGHNPLLFFLRCLDDNDELDELIKREIESRTWFLLCDSPNARDSKWVQMELDYIRQLPGKYTTTLDLTHEWDEQLETITGLSRRVTIFLAYASEDEGLVRPLAEALEKHEYRVFFELDIPPGVSYVGEVVRRINAAAAEGLILVLLSPSSLKSDYVLRETTFAMDKGGTVVPIIIAPFDERAMPNALELALAGCQYLDFTTGSFEDNMVTLLQVLRTRDIG